MKKFLTDVKTKNVGHGGVDLILTFSDNRFQQVHFQRGGSIDDAIYVLQVLKNNIEDYKTMSAS